MLANFKAIWVVDFEFKAPDGERPTPICLVAKELRSGRILRVWADELNRMKTPPFSMGQDSLFVAYYASAELGCHLALDWPMPERILDLFAEFRCLTSGLETPFGSGLLGAMEYFGLGGIEATEKEEMRNLALREGPYTSKEKMALLDYCQSDVDSLSLLLPAMLSKIDLPRALLRGRYMAASAHMEYAGVPIDTNTFQVLKENWDVIKTTLIKQVDLNYGVFKENSFNANNFEDYLKKGNFSWPLLDSGRLDLKDETFKTMVGLYPELRKLRELRKTLAQLSLNKLNVGSDGRNRCLLSCYRSKTGRNQPSNSKFIFGLPAWSRSLIRPEPGMALAYMDYEQQEFGVATALSGDPAMTEAYRTGDPYLAFAKQTGAAPADATKDSHAEVRRQFKTCALAVQYGMGAGSLAASLGIPEREARELLRLHRHTYPVFWEWIGNAVDHAMLKGWLHSVLGWKVHVEGKANPRSLMNFPMQANGAEILRLACCLLTERGITVCAPIHDAVLLEAPSEEIEATVALSKKLMQEASEVVLGGFPLRLEAKIIRHPDRFKDERGEEMWDLLMEILEEINVRAYAPLVRINACLPAHQRAPGLSYFLSE